MNRSLQEWLLWVDQGAGGRWMRRAVWLVGIALVSGLLCYKQFHGPSDERTFAQLVCARALAEGKGLSTDLHYPQALALSEARGVAYPLDSAVPELYQSPGYPALLAAGFRLLPESWRQVVFTRVLPGPDGFVGDYFVLGINLLLVWAALAMTWRLGLRWFDREVARLATWGLLFSSPLWAGTVSGNGVALPPLLLAVVALLLTRLIEADRAAGWLLPALVGGCCGALALIDYTWWLVTPFTLVWLWRACDLRQRLRVVALVAGAGLLVVVPWILRNVSLTGHPLGLAGQDWVLRTGDTTAEPELWRSRLSTELPPVAWDKIGNKLLTHVREVALCKFWAANWLLGAFALVGIFYSFRSYQVRLLRLWASGLFVLMLISEGVMGVGDEIRPAVVAFVPIVAVLGAGFFGVLAGSHPVWKDHLRMATFGLMGLQALPLGHDLLEPGRIRYHYPPYYPALFAAFREEVDSRKAGRWIWQCDVPAGAAWYSGRPVWAQPSNAEGFLALGSRQPILALVLTPRTLDRPYFSELARSDGGTTPVSWTWDQVYRGIAAEHLPVNFPLQRIERFAPNFVVLVDGRGAQRSAP